MKKIYIEPVLRCVELYNITDLMANSPTNLPGGPKDGGEGDEEFGGVKKQEIWDNEW